jgi:hypothetical protein
VPEVSLQRPRIDAVIRELVDAGVSQHVNVRLDAEVSRRGNQGGGFRYFVPRYGWYELVNHSASWTVWKWTAVPAHVHPTTKRLRGR